MEFVGNKAKGRISKRVLQENKARQIFRKMNISYTLIPKGFLLTFMDVIIIFRYLNISGCKDMQKLKFLSDKIFCDLYCSVCFNLESYLKNHLKWYFSLLFKQAAYLTTDFSQNLNTVFSLKKRIKSKKNILP